MKKQKVTGCFVFLLAFCFTCNNVISQMPGRPAHQLKDKLIGSWALYNDSCYTELHFVNDSTFVFLDSYRLSNSYSWIGEDTIQLDPFLNKYKVSIDKDTLKTTIENNIYKYERIKPEPSHFADDFFDGFMLRRCNFLISKGIISAQEAYRQLYSYIEVINYEVEDEIIPIRQNGSGSVKRNLYREKAIRRLEKKLNRKIRKEYGVIEERTY